MSSENNNKTIGKLKRNRIIGTVILLLLTGLMVFLGIRAFVRPKPVDRNPAWKSYLSLLNQNEKETWETHEQEAGTAYIQLNQLVVVEEGGAADLRLINPPYSAYDLKVVMESETGGAQLYESPVIQPGTVIEQIQLEQVYEEVYKEDKEEAVVTFEFYDRRGTLKRVESIVVVLQQKRGTQ